MKTRSIALSLALLTMTALGVRAQSFEIGVKGGINLNKIDGRSFNDQFKWGYAAGGYAHIGFGKWGIQPELLWNQTNTVTAGSFSDIYQRGLNNANVSLNYITVPLLLTYQPFKMISFQLGPQFGVLVNQTENLVQNTKEAFKKGDISGVAGAQLNLFRFRVGLRYFVGLNELNGLNSSLDSWKNQGFQAYLGFRLF
ncbi:MAG: porin family protein [Puia sp.]|nr:porin family protein [Puia sp.]